MSVLSRREAPVGERVLRSCAARRGPSRCRRGWRTRASRRSRRRARRSPTLPQAHERRVADGVDDRLEATASELTRAPSRARRRRTRRAPRSAPSADRARPQGRRTPSPSSGASPQRSGSISTRTRRVHGARRRGRGLVLHARGPRPPRRRGSAPRPPRRGPGAGTTRPARAMRA